MTDRPADAFDLAETYVHLPDGPAATPVAGGAAFWAAIDERTDLHEGRLVTVFPMAADWPHWEIHPEGDELVYLLSGAMDLILDEAGGKRVVALRAPAGAIVPRGVWHRAVVRKPGHALFVTRGKGTQHRPV
jgi:mannose-6-phosphate isomerase-like protein (cupin superfamily)